MSEPEIPLISPKKRHLMPSGKLRKALRSHGHALSVIVQIGKAGVTPALVKQLGQALDDHELVKVKVAPDGPADRFAAAEQLSALGGVNVVQIVGNIILLYKRHPRVARYEGKRARPAAGDETEPATEPTTTKKTPKPSPKTRMKTRTKTRTRTRTKAKPGAGRRARD